MSQSDIRRAARVIMERRGAHAERTCINQAQACGEAGRAQSAAIWLQLAAEIRRLQGREAARGIMNDVGETARRHPPDFDRMARTGGKFPRTAAENLRAQCEGNLERAERLLKEAEQRVAWQRHLVFWQRARGWNSKLSEDLLQTYEDTLAYQRLYLPYIRAFQSRSQAFWSPADYRPKIVK